ncbi:MAG: hypothetical protein ACXVVU_20700 [Solirubrobacteraceae bacterium]
MGPADRHDLAASPGHRSGVPAADLQKLSDEQREDLVAAHIADDIARDRALFAALPEDPDLRPTRRQRHQAIQALPADEVRRRAADYRDQRHRDRRTAAERPAGLHRRPPPGRR